MTTSRPLRGGLIGCGFFAQNHLNAWRDIAGVELAAVCDSDRAKAEAARDKASHVPTPGVQVRQAEQVLFGQWSERFLQSVADSGVQAGVGNEHFLR